MHNSKLLKTKNEGICLYDKVIYIPLSSSPYLEVQVLPGFWLQKPSGRISKSKHLPLSFTSITQKLIYEKNHRLWYNCKNTWEFENNLAELSHHTKLWRAQFCEESLLNLMFCLHLSLHCHVSSAYNPT